jgi:hypothetical protein
MELLEHMNNQNRESKVIQKLSGKHNKGTDEVKASI